MLLGPGHLRVISLTLSPTTGFPGPPTEVVTVLPGRELSRLARLMPSRLPPPPRAEKRLTVCFPMDLTIRLSDDSSVSYPACERPHALLRLIRAMCPLVRLAGFCHSQRHELGVRSAHRGATE